MDRPDPLKYWQEVAWVLDSHPLVDQKYSQEESVSSYINGIIEKGIQGRANANALDPPLMDFIAAFFFYFGQGEFSHVSWW